MQKHHAFHPDLLTAQKVAYEPTGFIIEKIRQEAESQEYAACSFEMNNKNVTFRVAKITHTKVGQFVTLWKRIGDSPIMPYDMADVVDFFIVSVRSGEHFGQFVFPKDVLNEKGFVSKDGIGGKRAMRVYPPWDATESAQAQKTQAWQIKYFFEIQPTLDTKKMKQLLYPATFGTIKPN